MLWSRALVCARVSAATDARVPELRRCLPSSGRLAQEQPAREELAERRRIEPWTPQTARSAERTHRARSRQVPTGFGQPRMTGEDDAPVSSGSPCKTRSSTEFSGQFATATGGWYTTVFPYARKLFFALVVIELTWAAALWVLDRDDPCVVATRFLKKIIATALLLRDSARTPASWIPAMHQQLHRYRSRRLRPISELTPSGVLSQGIDLAARCWSRSACSAS